MSRDVDLILVRHGEALDASEDPSRPLSPAGIAQVDRMARLLRDEVAVDVHEFWHSPKKRAEQTAQILKNTLYPSASLTPRIDLQPTSDVGSVIQDIEQTAVSVAIAGHLPHLAYLTAALLVGDPHKAFVLWPTAGVVILTRSAGQPWLLKGMISPTFLKNRG